jgi:hypothetical protein
VDQDLAEQPFTPEEMDHLEAKGGPPARQKVESRPERAYGATLLAVAVTDAYLVYLQQGDGDILRVTSAGEVERPLPPDARLMANETTSLSNPDDVTAIRVGFEVVMETPPALILACTDGYANSFADPDFLKIGPDYLRALRADGLEKVQACLAGWLRETSDGGSGDDVTVGLLCRLDALAEPPARAAPAAVADEAKLAEINAPLGAETNPAAGNTDTEPAPSAVPEGDIP